MESLAKDTRSSVLDHIKAVMTVRLAQKKRKRVLSKLQSVRLADAAQKAPMAFTEADFNPEWQSSLKL